MKEIMPPSEFHRPRSVWTYLPRDGWRLLAVSMLCAALLATVGIARAYYNMSKEHPAAATVRSYLTALQEKNLSEIDEYIGHTAGKMRFLNADAANTDFSIHEIALIDTGGMLELTAEVAVTIGAADGQKSTGVFRVEKDPDTSKWVITDPYTKITFGDTGVGRIAVNDHVFAPPDSVARKGTFALYPGVQRFHDIESPWMTRHVEPMLTLNENILLDGDGTEGRFLLNEAGDAELQGLVDEYIDACVEKSESDLLPRRCPFGLDVDMHRYYRDFKSPTWSVVDYPVVTGVDSGGYFRVQNRKAGTIELSGTAVESDGSEKAVTLTCPIHADLMAFDVDADDVMEILPDEMLSVPGTC